MDMVDQQLSQQLSQFTNCLATIMSVIVLILLVHPYILVALIPLVALYYRVTIAVHVTQAGDGLRNSIPRKSTYLRSLSGHKITLSSSISRIIFGISQKSSEFRRVVIWRNKACNK